MSLLQQEPQDIVSEESQEDGEDDLQSATWQEIARNYIVVLQDVNEEIIKPVKNGDKHPDHLVELANTVSMISSGFDTLELTHEEKFEQLRANTSGLVVVLWHLYNKSRKLWPPPKFRAPIKEFMETVHCIHELMGRKSEENLAKRLFVGSFGIRDLGKFKRYLRKLGSMASFLEGKPNNVNIGEVLLEVVNGHAQPQDTDTELPDEAAHSPTKNGAKRKTDTQENKAEGSRQRQATVDKPTKETAKHEQVIDDEEKGQGKESKASGKKKAKDTTKDESAAVKAEERSAEDDESAKTKPKRASTGAKKVTPPKLEDQDLDLESDDKGKGISQASDDDEVKKADAPASDPVATSVPRKKKLAKPKVRSKTIPELQTSNSISGISFHNNGSGHIFTNNVGNIVNSSISNIGNDYSMNYGHARRKGTHG